MFHCEAIFVDLLLGSQDCTRAAGCASQPSVVVRHGVFLSGLQFWLRGQPEDGRSPCEKRGAGKKRQHVQGGFLFSTKVLHLHQRFVLMWHCLGTFTFKVNEVDCELNFFREQVMGQSWWHYATHPVLSVNASHHHHHTQLCVKAVL